MAVLMKKENCFTKIIRTSPDSIAAFAKKMFSGIACAFGASCVLASCDLFSVSVPAFFEEYTNTAAVVKHTIDTTNYSNAAGVSCVPSGSNCSITFTLRNPQQYVLGCLYSYSGTAAKKADADLKDITFSQSDDKSTITAQIPSSLLATLDCGTDKDLTFTLNMMEPKSGRTFDPYTVTLSANSAPPDIDNPLCIIDTTDTNNEKWILCFNMPGTTYTDSTTGIYNDIKTITIDGIAYTVTLNSSGAYTFGDTKLSTTAPASTSANPTSKLTFTNVSGTELQSVYFSSGESTTTYKDKTYTVTCTDSAGLSSTVLVPTIAYQLSSPVACDISVSSTTLTAGGSTDNTITQQFAGDGRITISADAKTSQDSSGNTITYSSTGASIVYKVYDSAGTTLKKSGSISGLSGTVSLDPGIYIVKAFVRKSLYANSETVSWKCTVTPTNFFVSSSGDDTNGAGTLASPYATITKAITAIETPVSGTNYTIYVLSDLSNSISGDYITINKSTLSVTIQGSDTSGTAVQRTIDADRNAASTGSVFNITNAASVTLKNLKLTGGYATNGGGINAAGGTTILSDTTVTGNTATTGSGIYIASGATVTVQGGTVITPSGTGANDVYLESGAYLSVGTLTGSDTVACITPTTYDVDTPAVLLKPASGATLSQDICNRFTVTSNNSQSYVVLYNDTDTQGVLAKAGVTSSITMGSYTFAVVDSYGEDLSSVKQGGSVYWKITSGTTVATSSVSGTTSGVTSTTITLLSNGGAVKTSTLTDGKTGVVAIPSYLVAGTYSLYLEAVINGYTYSGYATITVTE